MKYTAWGGQALKGKLSKKRKHNKEDYLFMDDSRLKIKTGCRIDLNFYQKFIYNQAAFQVDRRLYLRGGIL